jgi:hypothetical protein
MKILITRVTTPTCIYIQAFFDQNSTCARMSGLPYPLMNRLPHWHGTNTNDYVKTANERMVEQTEIVNVTRRPFAALTQSRSATETSDLQPTTTAAIPRAKPLRWC